MKRIKLNERDLSRIVKRVIKEDYSNVDEYEKRYSELVNKLSNLVSELDNLANEFEDLGEEVYSQVDPMYDDEGNEVDDYDKEQMNVELEDIAQSAVSYAEIISRCSYKITGYM